MAPSVSYQDSVTFLLFFFGFHPEADLETSIQGEGVYLGGDPTKN